MVVVDWELETGNPTPQEGAAKIFDPAFLVSYQDRLRSLYGSVPHRISHLTAMEMAPAAIKAGMVVHVSGPPVDGAVAASLQVRSHEESEATLTIGAVSWEGPTWISQPERALLECLKSEDHVPDGEVAAARVLHTGRVVSAETVMGLAGRLGWDQPLRRLASIAARMDNCRGVFPYMPDGFLASSQRELLDVSPAGSNSEWICVISGRHPEPGGQPAFRDEKYRVVWCWEHPHELLEDLLR